MKKREIKTITITPKRAIELLEANKNNRPITQAHVNRIAAQIFKGLWKFNGDTIKIAVDGDVLDGQHRLWAIIMADTAVETIVVYGIEKDAFATIDTIRKVRSGADILSLHGCELHRRSIATALTWLIRWQNGGLVNWRSPKNRVENSDVEASYAAHPEMAEAVDRVSCLRGLIGPGAMGFLYYVFVSRNQKLADQFIDTLESPAGVPVNHPFFRFRVYLLMSQERLDKRRSPVEVFALAFKAWKAATEGKQIEVLSWRTQGPTPEKFPELV